MTSSPYWVSPDRHPVRVDLIERTEDIVIGKYSGYLEVQFSANDTVRTSTTAHVNQMVILS